MKRIFVGIKISPQLQGWVLIWEKHYRTIPVRWTPVENLHITLLPPWEAGDEEIEEIKKSLLEVGKLFKPFNAHFTRIKFAPDVIPPRMIWAEGHHPEELVSLKKELERVMGNSEPGRKFLLHLTLARFRPEMFFSFPVKELNEEISWIEKMEGFELIESRLLPSGAEYRTLMEVKFCL